MSDSWKPPTKAQFMSVPCPYCWAGKRKPCYRIMGYKVVPIHKARKIAYRMKRNAEQRGLIA